MVKNELQFHRIKQVYICFLINLKRNRNLIGIWMKRVYIYAGATTSVLIKGAMWKSKYSGSQRMKVWWWLLMKGCTLILSRSLLIISNKSWATWRFALPLIIKILFYFTFINYMHGGPCTQTFPSLAISSISLRPSSYVPSTLIL